MVSRWQALIKFRVKSLYRPASLRPYSRPRIPSAGFSLSPFPFFSGPLRSWRARRSARSPLAARRIVTKGFAVILDLICMLMVMDVYLLLFPGFVAACYPPLKSWQQLARKKCRWPLMFYQVVLVNLHLSFKSRQREYEHVE